MITLGTLILVLQIMSLQMLIIFITTLNLLVKTKYTLVMVQVCQFHELVILLYFPLLLLKCSPEIICFWFLLLQRIFLVFPYLQKTITFSLNSILMLVLLRIRILKPFFLPGKLKMVYTRLIHQICALLIHKLPSTFFNHPLL